MHIILYEYIWALCYYALLMMINWWEKWIDFMQVKFDSNENTKWHCTQLGLNWIHIWLNLNSIDEIGMQIGA
jgi:hypothetical protein